MTIRLAVLFAAALLVPACRILPEPTPEPTYYIALTDHPPASPPSGAMARTPLRLAPVTAAPAIGERFAFTTDNVMRFDELMRWHEPPEVSLQRRLTSQLYGPLGYERSTHGQAARVTVDLLRYEADLDDNTVLVRAHVAVHRNSGALGVEKTISKREAVADITSGTSIARATGAAVEGLIDDISIALMGAR